VKLSEDEKTRIAAEYARNIPAQDLDGWF